MRAAGLEPRIDTAANIFATRAGTDATLKPILFGSHIDSVPSGGNFDGDLGSLAAIEAVRTLHDHVAGLQRAPEITRRCEPVGEVVTTEVCRIAH